MHIFTKAKPVRWDSRLSHKYKDKRNTWFYTDRYFQRKMKSNFLYFIQFCIKCNKIWYKQRIFHVTIHANDKSVDSLISYSTNLRHKRGIHSNNTFLDFALEVSFSILHGPWLLPDKAKFTVCSIIKVATIAFDETSSYWPASKSS